MWDERKKGAIEARVRVICGGDVKVEFVESLEDGACTIKLSEGQYIEGLGRGQYGQYGGKWKQVLPINNEDVALHELAHMKCSSFASTAAYNSLAKRGQDLYVMLEEVRVDLIASNHWHCNVHTNHGKQLAEGMASMGDGEALKDIVTRIGYGILMPLTSPLSQDVEARFGDRIRALGEGDDPLVAVRLAFEIDAAYPDEPEPDQPDAEGKGQPDDDGEGQPDTDGEGDDGKGDGKGDDKGDGEGDGEGDDGEGDDGEGDGAGEGAGDGIGRGLNDTDEAEWDALLKDIEKLEEELRERAAEEIKRAVDLDKYDGHAPSITALSGNQVVPVVVRQATQMAIDHMKARQGDRRERVGAVTGDVWRLNQGTVDVFRSPTKNKGKTVVMADMSGSMGSWCECHGVGNGIAASGGWLAMQVTAAVSMATDAACFGFSSGEIGEWESGMQPSHSFYGFGGGTPTDMALRHLKEVLRGETAGALGVLVTDGAPNDVEATLQASEELYAEGLDFVVVVVGMGDGTGTWADWVNKIFPSAPIVWVNEVEDIANVGEAIVREMN